ncbi:MAG TPA: hypothetical protein VNH18_01390 [Bryobacteraceae bacterium]|nr:hypothetical protein [Bryobacteraceae bacterium]
MRTPAVPARYLAILGAVALSAIAPALWAWGQDGHFLVARLAVAALPPDMPKFFTGAAETLVLLNPEPDTWRDSAEGKLSPALRLGHDPDHFFKFELYSPAALPPDRYSFLEDLRQQGKLARQVGMLPYRAMELFQRVRSGFRRWRAATDPGTSDPKMARFIEARIIEDAGLLGHYIADAAMPLHMSVNPNGWTLEENPRGYTRDNTLHRRFETDFVRARIHDGDVKPLLRETTVASDPFASI